MGNCGSGFVREMLLYYPPYIARLPGVTGCRTFVSGLPGSGELCTPVWVVRLPVTLQCLNPPSQVLMSTCSVPFSGVQLGLGLVSQLTMLSLL